MAANGVTATLKRAVGKGERTSQRPTAHPHTLSSQLDVEGASPHPAHRRTLPFPGPRPRRPAPSLRPPGPILTSLPATKQPNMAAAAPLSRQGPEAGD